MGGAAAVLFLAFLALADQVPILAADNGGAEDAAGRVVQVQSVEPAVRGGSRRYNATSVAGRKDGGGGGGGGGDSSGGSSWSYGWGWGWGTEGGGGGGVGGGGGGGGTTTRTQSYDDGGGAAHSHGRRRARRRHRPNYSSSLYRVAEYARCTAPGRCRGMRLLCPMHCDGPCFYDCDANCKPHCRF